MLLSDLGLCRGLLSAILRRLATSTGSNERHETVRTRRRLDVGVPAARPDVQELLDPWTRWYLSALGVGSGRLDAATLDAASALLEDPNYWTQCWMMTAVWVRKPQA